MNTPDCQCEAILALIQQSLDLVDTLDQTQPVLALKRLFQAQYARITSSHDLHLHPPIPETITPLAYEKRVKSHA